MAVGRRELMLGTLGMGLLPAPRSSPAIQSAVRRTARSARERPGAVGSDLAMEGAAAYANLAIYSNAAC